MSKEGEAIVNHRRLLLFYNEEALVEDAYRFFNVEIDRLRKVTMEIKLNRMKLLLRVKSPLITWKFANYIA